MTDLLHSARDGRVLRLTLNRPAKRNALDAALCRALVDEIEDAGRDPAIGAILLTATAKVFCAGMDLAEIENTAKTAEVTAIPARLFPVRARLPQPLGPG